MLFRVVYSFIVVFILWFNSNTSSIIKNGRKKVENTNYVQSISVLDRTKDEIQPTDNKNSSAKSVSNQQQLKVDQIIYNGLNVGANRYKRGTKYIEININGTDFLDMISNNVLREASSYILKICTQLLVCNYIVTDADFTVQLPNFTLCSKKCHLTKSCCPVVDPEHVSEVAYIAGAVCRYPLLFFIFKDYDDLNQMDEFNFIAACPLGGDITMKVLCEQPYKGQGYSMIDLLPVTNDEHMLNFANRHCAKCNNFTQNLHLWLPNVRCTNPIEVSSIYDIEDAVRLRPDCYILLQPPATVDVNSSRCFSNLVTECNTTGLWVQYNSLMEEACHSSQAVYLSTPYKTRYHNIFCAICNSEDITIQRIQYCPGRGPQSTRSGFTALMAYSLEVKHSESRSTYKTNICYGSLTYDKITKDCQTVHCSFPLRLDPYRLECIEGLLKSEGGFISIAMRVRHNEPVLFTNIDMLLDTLTSVFRKITVRICGIYFYSKTNISFRTWERTLGKKRNKMHVKENVIVVKIFESDIINGAFSPLASFNKYISLLTFQYEMTFESDYFSFDFETSIYNSDAFPLRLDNVDRETDSSVFAMEDPYSGYTFLRHFNFDVDYCNRGVSLFTPDFFKCPAFLYDTALYGITRHSEGLYLASLNATFDFGTFQSKNETHVYICADYVYQIVKTSSGSYTYGYVYSSVVLSFISMVMVTDILRI